MRLLIATPAYGGLVTSRYLQSMVATTRGLLNDGIEFALFTLENESLISRARNRCVMYAMENNYTHLLFIDADMIWTYNSLKLLLKSKQMIVGGTYPLKSFPLQLNLNPLPEQREFSIEKRTLADFKDWAHLYADERGEVEVRHIPTGFMLINCEVFIEIAVRKLVQGYKYFDSATNSIRGAYDMFPVRVHEDQYESEDWAFCTIAREAGFKIYLQTKAINAHTGNIHYGLGEPGIGT